MKIPQKIIHIIFIIFLTLFCLFGLTIAILPDFLTPINNFFIYRTGGEQWQDKIYQHKIAPKSKIALILIDEKTLNTYQSDKDAKILTIPKATYGRLIDELENIGVKGIGFDIIFQNPDEQEEAFAQKVIHSANTVIATGISSQTFEEIQANSDEKSSDPCMRSGYERICPLTPREIYKKARWGAIATNGTKRITGYDLSQVDTQKWKISGESISKDEIFVYTFPLALVQNKNTPTIQKLKKNIKSPTHEQYMGAPGSYETISLVDFLKNTEKYKEIVKDAYILVGESGTIMHDEVTSPVNNGLMPGVESHAHFLDAILQEKILVPANQGLMFLMYVILSITFVLIYYFVPNIFSLSIFVISSLATIWCSRYLYDQERILVDILPLLLSVSILSYPITMIYRFFIVDRQKRRIVASFGRYVSPKVVKLINSSDIEAEIGGEKKELSILFSDIASFTTLSEKMETRDLFLLMVSYLSRMTDILLEEGGTLDKYIGDAVMGFFGAPITQDNHAIRACTTAIKMRGALDRFNTEIALRNIDPIDFRIGIATGEVMVGNIGSANRFNYTVLGDRVNLASRLEATGKEYKVHTIIAHDTVTEIGDTFFTRELDTIAVKGKSQGVRIFELIDFPKKVKNRDIYYSYEKALALYRSGEYEKARDIWNQQAQIDPPSQVMAVRCTRVLNKQVDIENAIYRMEHK